MKFMVFDFETVDPYLSNKIDLGPGWVFMRHVPGSLARIVGFSYCYIEGNTITAPIYKAFGPEEMRDLKDALIECPNVIMHNAQYDVGYLLAQGVDISRLQVYDTKVMARLYDNTRMSYSLESLSKDYLPITQQKEKFNLSGVVREHGLIKMKPTCRTYEAAATKWAYENMDIIQEKDFNAMARYANQDVTATAHLFIQFLKRISLDDAQYYSHFQLICTKMRDRGISVDMVALNSSIEKMYPIVEELKQKVFDLVGRTFNLDSPRQLADVLQVQSTAKDFLEKMNTPVSEAVLEYREANKLLRDFLINIRDMQIYTCPEAAAGGAVGKIYPQFELFGAQTGRFSSSKPNVQQIPKASKEYGNLCRSIFIPNTRGSEWVSLDWSNQEGRLAVHYAKLIGAKGADEVAKIWNADPRMDMHQRVADLAGISRSQAKTINLGLMYSMGQASLCKKLGLPTAMESNKYGIMETAGPEGKQLLATYHRANPWLKEFNDKAKEIKAANKGVRTLGGRFLRRDDPRYDYKALNQIIQGSAADQMLWVLRKADDAGIPILALVHDEFCIEGAGNAKKMVKLMESRHLYGKYIEVPVPVDVEAGPSWGDLKELDSNA